MNVKSHLVFCFFDFVGTKYASGGAVSFLLFSRRQDRGISNNGDDDDAGRQRAHTYLSGGYACG